LLCNVDLYPNPQLSRHHKSYSCNHLPAGLKKLLLVYVPFSWCFSAVASICCGRAFGYGAKDGVAIAQPLHVSARHATHPPLCAHVGLIYAAQTNVLLSLCESTPVLSHPTSPAIPGQSRTPDMVGMEQQQQDVNMLLAAGHESTFELSA
jgi:hypothetical protein